MRGQKNVTCTSTDCWTKENNNKQAPPPILSISPQAEVK